MGSHWGQFGSGRAALLLPLQGLNHESGVLKLPQPFWGLCLDPQAPAPGPST